MPNEWVENAPNGAPCAKSVNPTAPPIWRMELSGTIKIRDDVYDSMDSTPIISVSAAINVVAASRDRNVRTFNLFLLPSLKTFADVMLRILEVRNGSVESIAHLADSRADRDGGWFVVEHRRHVRWGKPTSYRNPCDRETWGGCRACGTSF